MTPRIPTRLAWAACVAAACAVALVASIMAGAADRAGRAGEGAAARGTGAPTVVGAAAGITTSWSAPPASRPAPEVAAGPSSVPSHPASDPGSIVAQPSSAPVTTMRLPSTVPATVVAAAGPATTSAPAGHLATLPPGATLPTGAECAARVRTAPAPAEVKAANAGSNQMVLGVTLPGATGLDTRVDGNFTGTTEQILRWAACKWGIDEDLAMAEAAVLSSWRMDALGDPVADPSRCPPGSRVIDRAPAGQCSQSWGLFLIRYPDHPVAFPFVLVSTALNADYALARWRACFEGDLGGPVLADPGTAYGPGDAWGCVGHWVTGRWHGTAADGWISRIQQALAARTWTAPEFRQT